MRKSNIVAAGILLASIAFQFARISVLLLGLVTRLGRVATLRILSILSTVRCFHVGHIVASTCVQRLREFAVMGPVDLHRRERHVSAGVIRRICLGEILRQQVVVLRLALGLGRSNSVGLPAWSQIRPTQRVGVAGLPRTAHARLGSSRELLQRVAIHHVVRG